MEQDIKDKLEELKNYLTNLSPNNIKEFDELIESIKNNLPEAYRDKLSALKFYELYEEQDFSDDLPF